MLRWEASSEVSWQEAGRDAGVSGEVMKERHVGFSGPSATVLLDDSSLSLRSTGRSLK